MRMADFSSLDPNFREEIRQLLQDLHRETAISVSMVTHDFSEAHFLAHRLAIINAGRIEQIGNVTTVFQFRHSQLIFMNG